MAAIIALGFHPWKKQHKMKGNPGGWSAGRWEFHCVLQSIVFGLSGTLLTALAVIDADSCVTNKVSVGIGVGFTVIGPFFSAVAG